MAKTLKSKVVNYRRCMADAPADPNGKHSFNLQNLTDSAALKVKKPWIRPISAGSERVHFLAHLVAKQGCTCGTLVLYEHNKLVPLIDAEKDGTTWEGTVEPKDAAGRKRKLQEQALYFAIRENHVAVIQTKELGIQEFQDFLVWFIQSQAALADGWLFVLQNLPSESASNKIKDHNVRRIKIGKDAFTAVKTEIPSQDSKSKRKRYSTTIETDPWLLELLKSFIKDDAVIDDMTNSADPGSIHVDLDIKYRSRTEKDSQRVMRSLAAVVGGNPDLEPTIELEGGKTISGDELTIRGKVNVQCPRGNPSSDDAMTQVANWLIQKIKEKKDIV